MKENDLTEEDLDLMWEFLKEYKLTKFKGIDWRDLRLQLIKEIKTLYDSIEFPIKSEKEE